MKSKAKVVVIGGGVVGVSTLYHLAKKGWSDVVLCERKELTSGSTWHAAGLMPLFNMSYSVGQIHKYSVKFYQELEKETGQDVGFREVSNIRLAENQDRMDEYRQYAGVAETIGVKVNFLTPEEIQKAWPLCSIDGLVGAIQHPEDGYIQPNDLTQALAKGARALGAEIYRQTAVTALEQLPDDSWIVTTDKGEIKCDVVVSCSGNFVRQTGEMVGLDIPVIPVEHQYIVTEAHPKILERQKEGLPEMGVLRGSDGAWYMREEAGGLILGPYEKGAPACYVDGPSKDCEYELFQEDLDRLGPHIEHAINRVPIFGEAGIKKVYNGAICYTPDGSPIIGPAWDRKNLYLNDGHSFGVTAAGGAGWQIAEWIVDGEPTIDMLGVEPRRFGDYASKAWFEHIGNECKNVSENVGLLDMSAFAKCRISGPGAEEFLDNLVANKLPKKIGRTNLCHALNTKGGVHSEFTIMRESADSFYCVSAGAWQRLDHDWVKKHMPEDRSVKFENITNQMGVLVLAGPKSRELLERVSSDDFSNEAFPWLSGKNIKIGSAETLAIRVNFVGELGWEIHSPIEVQNHIFDALMDAGKDLGLKPFGIRAMDSLRLEKSYKLIGTELSIEYAGYESGIDRFIHPNKGQFIGRDALVQWREKGFENSFVTLEVHGVSDADVLGNNPIYSNGKVVGRATGGNYGFRVNKSLALAMVNPAQSEVGTKLQIDILGNMHDVTVIPESPYDPKNEKIRA